MATDEARRDAPRLWPIVAAVAALASLPYLSLLAANVGEALEIGRVLVWWAVTLGIGLLPLAVAARRGRATARWVGGLSAVALYLFFNYPSLVDVGDSLGAPLPDLAWWALASAVVIGLALPLVHTRTGQAFLQVWAPALLLLPVVQLVTAGPATASDVDGPSDDAVAVVLERRPNVYWFVLDGLAGPPVLRDRAGVDTGPFLSFLRDEGFSVQEQAHSNYPLTHLAVASALDMEYLYEGLEEPKPGPFFERLRGDNRTVRILRANGYGYVHAYPGLWSGSRCVGLEDVCLGAHGTLNDTQWALASRTPLVDLLVGEDDGESVAETNDPVHVVDAVLSGSPDRPYLAFMHLLNPHPPFLRDADCRARDVPLLMAAWGDGPEYGAAVTCLFERLTSAVQRILAVDDDPVIIITGDHGPRLGLGPDTTGPVVLDAEMNLSAFNAIRLPRDCTGADVPDDLTFVNTFRVVLGCLTDAPVELLPDRIHPIRREY